MIRLSSGMVIALLLAAMLAGCAAPGPAPQPLAFSPAPWADGEVSRYDVRARDGSAAGTATWTWQQTADGWSQVYALDLGGRADRGQVLVGQDLQPVSSWRELNGQRIDTAYGLDKVTIETTGSDGKAMTKELARPADALDNDATLLVQRALPLAAGYATRYTDVIPTTGATAPVKLTVTSAETVTVPAGTFATWHVVMDFGSGSHDAWYGQAAPHLLVKYRNRSSGSEFLLSAWQAAAGSPLQGSPAPTATPAASAAPPTAPAAPVPLNVPFLLSSLLVQYPLMLAFPLLLGRWIRRRYGVSWRVFGAGALTFIASQVVHLPLNAALGLLGGGRGVALWPLPAVALVAGLSAGLCEEGARWIVLRFFVKRRRGWRNALQYGAGHGGAEAIIFGLVALVGLVSMLVMRALPPSTLGLSGPAADQTRAAMVAYWNSAWYLPIVGGVERLFAITCQIAMAVLVMAAVTRGRPGYWLAALAFHTALDFWAVWSAPTWGTIATEAGVAVAALVGLWIIVRLRETPEPPAVEPAPAEAPGGLPAYQVPAGTSADLGQRLEDSRFE